MKQKNQLYLLITVVMLVISTISIVKFASQNYSAGIFMSVIFLMISTSMLNHWGAISYIWTCEVCGEVRELSVIENFIYISIGVNKKYFHCNECGVKRIFEGKYKY